MQPPLLTKAGKVAKRPPAPHQDPPAHFYSAQLLTAFATSGSLVVPEAILKLEETLRKEYGRANEIARKNYEQEQKRREIDEERQRKKRKRDRDAIMQEFIDAEDQEHSGGIDIVESNTDEISPVQLRDAIATLPERCLRDVLAKLVDEIPVLERAMMRELSKLQLSGDDDTPEMKTMKVALKAVKDKGKEKVRIDATMAQMITLIIQ